MLIIINLFTTTFPIPILIQYQPNSPLQQEYSHFFFLFVDSLDQHNITLLTPPSYTERSRLVNGSNLSPENNPFISSPSMPKPIVNLIREYQ